LAFGQVNKAGQDLGWTDGQNNGAFTESIPIEVPPFHGIEPHLSVNYSSDSSFGLMGVGWSLTGFSTIERTNSTRGAPSYDGGVASTADIFILDGEELLRCPTGSQSPSCTTGGNFTTLVEGYRKILYTASNDTWSVTDKEGTVYAYAPVWQEPTNNVGNYSGQMTWRYGLQSVTDTLGNTVTYNWVQNLFSPKWTTPSSITYNGNTININYLQLPAGAPIGYSDGISMIHIQGVIQSIDVQVSGSRAHTHQFTYTTSAQTGQLVLTSVQLFGKDAVLNASGAVTSGTSLPAMTLSYSTTNTAFTSGSQVNGFTAYNTNDQFLSMDVNGDGYEDLVSLAAPSSGPSWIRQIWFGSASGGFTAGPIDSSMDYNSTGTSHYLVADVNGDGKADMIEVCGNTLHCNTTRFTRHIWLSNGSAFTSGAVDTAVSYSSTSQFLVEDVNGDGKQDVVELYPGASLIRHVWVSNGSAFTSGAQDNLTKYTTTPAYYLSEDVNGDGKGDMVEIHIDPDNTHWDLQLWLSNGGSFTAAPLDKSMTYNVNSRFLAGDYNGDGQGDFVELRPSGSNWIRTPHNSMGNFFGASTGVDSTMWYQSTSADQYYMADFNGDGHQDMLELSNSGSGKFIRHIWPYTPANNQSFRSGAIDTSSAYVSTSRFLPMDVNGDGLSDVVEFWMTGTSTWGMHVWLNSGPGVPDLLTGITHESGGTTTIAYKPSSAWSNTNNPGLMQTVSSVTESDGRGWSSTTSFSYAGALFDWSTHKFQGFHTITRTEPCLSGESSCPYVVETFDQPTNCGSLSPRIETDYYDGSGNIYELDGEGYTYSCSSAPYTQVLANAWHSTFLPGNWSVYKQTDDDYYYDAYGNVTLTVDQGDTSLLGDETTTQFTFNYNTSAFLVAHAASATTYAGNGTGGAMLAQTLNYYDCDPVTLQNCSNSAAPTKGLLNRADEYLNRQSYSNLTSSYLTTKSLYDSHGNVTDTYDANNNHTSVAYDTTYSVYSTKATNALGQCATSGYDYVCGSETSATDLNSQTTTTTLDALCRPTQVSLPNGGYVKTQYLNFGNPSTQYVETDIPGPSGDIYSRRYFDGLSRDYKALARGVSADTEVDTTFDARGNTSTVTNPYFVGSSSVAVTYNYDALNRQTKVTLPDNNTAQTFYGTNSNCNSCSLWSVTSLDPLGHKETDWHDAHGNRIEHDEYVGGAWSSATYAYDLLNHLSTATDPTGNVIAYTVDSLGRALGVNDPDQGLWTYTYDADGNVLTETDALVTPVVSYAYDALNRLSSKTTSGDGNTFTWAYDQAVGGGPGSHAHTGTWSAEAVLVGGYSNLFQAPTVSPNQTYTVSIWLQGAGSVYLYVDNGNWGSNVAGQQCTASSSWSQCSMTVATGSNTQMTFIVQDNYGGGTVYIDDAFFGVAGQANTLANPGFESGNGSWGYGSAFSIGQSSSNLAHTGTWSAEAALVGGYSNLFQAPTVAPNQTYTVSIWLQGSGSVYLYVDNGNWGSNVAGQQCTASSYWTQCSMTVPTGSNTQMTFIIQDNYGGGGNVYIDDAFFGVSGQTNTLANPGFESGNGSWGYGSAFSIVQSSGPTYYNVGRLTTKTDPYGSQTFNYDNVGNVVATIRTTDGVNYPFSYTYDIVGRLLTEGFPDGDSVGTVVYDAAGRLSSIPSLVTSVAYDALGRATQVVNANGTTQTSAYDTNRQWLTNVTTTQGTTNLQNVTYGFDADGNRTSVTSTSTSSSDESWTYGYDELHRVVSATDTSNSAYNQTFSYAANGNILTNSRVGTYTYPSQGAGSVLPHAVTAASGNTYAYNANGQMTSRAGTALSWNGDHLMSNDGSNAYYYGGNRELLKLVNGSNTTRYLGDDFEVSPNGVQNKYIAGVAVRVGTGSSASRWIHSDFNGSLQVQTDGNGNESMRKKYYVTGDALSTTGTDSQSKGFTGQRQESSGLTYMHERFYDPLLGRFVSPDPATPEHHGNAGLNRYAYAMNDFVNNEDTSGFMIPMDGGGACGNLACVKSVTASRARASRTYSYYPSNNYIDQGGTLLAQQMWRGYQYQLAIRWAASGGPHNDQYYRAVDFWGRRGRLGRQGRCGCSGYHAPVAKRRTTPGRPGRRIQPPPPKQQCGGMFSWITCHWRGAAQVGADVVGVGITVGVCIATSGAGCGAGAAAGNLLATAVYDATDTTHKHTPMSVVGDLGLAAASGIILPGPEWYIYGRGMSLGTPGVSRLVGIGARAAGSAVSNGINAATDSSDGTNGYRLFLFGGFGR
jgi:RHS repeat-associated protein